MTLLVATTPAIAQQANIADVERRVRAAHGDFERLYAMRRDLQRLGATAGPFGDRVLELAFASYWPWRGDPQHGANATRLLAGTAAACGRRVLERGDDPTEVLPMLERAFALRDRGGHRMCELGLTLVDAYRTLQRFDDTERTLAACERMTTDEARAGWSLVGTMMAPILELHLLTRRAALELSLGNPDGMLPYLRRAARVLRRPRAAAERPVYQPFLDQAWSDASAELLRQKVDALLGLEMFGAAVATAEAELTAVVRGETDVNRQLAEFYLLIARSHDRSTTSRDRPALRRQLRTFASTGTPAQRRIARARLVTFALQEGDLDAVERDLADPADRDPSATTARTDWLLLSDQQRGVAELLLRRQRHRQREAFERLLQRWQDVPSRDSGVGFLHFLFRRETIGQLVAITLRCGRGDDGEPSQQALAEAFADVMRAQVQNGLARNLGVDVPSVATVQAGLGADHVALVYLPTRTCTHLFAVGRERLDYVRLADGALGIRDGIQRFVGLLRTASAELDPTPRRAQELAAGLHEVGKRLGERLLPAPVRDRLRTARRVTVIGGELLHGPVAGDEDAGLLNYLPFECLPWQPDRLFGQQFAVDHNVSLPVWLQIAQRTRPFDDRSQLSVFGTLRRVGAVADGVPSLAGTRMQEMLSPFERSERHLDADCTMAAVGASAEADPDRRGRRIAVFVAHGGYDASTARGSFLQLHDGRLDCETAQGLGSAARPFADLVVLAACRAAKAPTRAGDQLANLGGAFLLAGAGAVVQARFDLQLHRTQELLATMLRGLAVGEAPAEAIRAARAACGRSDPLDAFRAGLLQVHGCGQPSQGR